MGLFQPSAGSGGLVQHLFLGTNQDDYVNHTTSAFRSAGIWVAPSSGSVTGIRLGTYYPQGTVTGIAAFDLYATDSSHLPTGSPLASGTATPVHGFNDWSFSSPYTVAAGTEYAFVLRNTAAVPASNYFRVHRANPAGMAPFATLLLSTDSGSTWAPGDVSSLVVLGAAARMFPIYDGTGCAAPLTECWGDTSAFTTALYNSSGSRTARMGLKVRFATPQRLHAFTYRTTKIGSPTFAIKGEIFDGSGNLLATSTDTGSASVDGAKLASFSPAYTLKAATDYYLSVTPVGATAGDASNYIRIWSSSAFAQTSTIGPILQSVGSTSAVPSWSYPGGSNRLVTQFGLYVEPMGGGVLVVDGAGGING